MLDYVSNIMEKIGKLDNYTNFNKMPVLTRNNRIRSIHSSLAIEANSLSLGQVKDIIVGRIVIGPQKEILRATYLDPAIKEGVVALTIPDKPTSKNQMYYKL